MKSSRNNRLSLRRTRLEELEPRRLLAGHGDEGIVLPAGPAGEFLQQHAGLLRSPAQWTLFGSQLTFDGLTPKALRSKSEGLGNFTTSNAATRLYEAESLDASLLDVNDIAEAAQHLPLGFGIGQTVALDVRGSIEEPLLPGTVNSVEDDGSIPLANDSNLIQGAAVTAVGTIGDGPQLVTGDYDFFRIPDVKAGDLITARVVGTDDQLDPAVVIYNSVGEVKVSNDDAGNTVDSFASYIASEDDDYYVLVLGSGNFGFSLPANPFNPASGDALLTSTGPYEATIGLNYGDVDYYSVDLSPGDIFSLDMLGASNDVALFHPTGYEIIGNRDAGAGVLFPVESELTSNGNAMLAYVANEPGEYFVRVLGDYTGNYEGRFRVHRPVLEQEEPGTKQVLFLDFDGETIDRNIFLSDVGPGIVELSPMSAFLSGWGLSANQENAVIDSVLEVVHQKFDDVGLNGRNDDFGIEIRNSRDHADPYGQPNVSRVIVGGTIFELGIPTIGIAQSVDVGNFDTEETAVVLLDTLSSPSIDPETGLINEDSLNSYLVNEPGKSKVDLVGLGIASVVVHEAAHTFGNWHTNLDNDISDLMDPGGDRRAKLGIGEDGILGTQDDVNVLFGIDEFSPSTVFTGIQDSRNNIAFSLPTGEGKNSADATGFHWDDINGDGTPDPGEPGLPDTVIYVDYNGDGEFGIAEPAAVTDANGHYLLKNVPAGTYTVRTVLKPGRVLTYPESGSYTINFQQGGEIRGVNFGSQRGHGDDEGTDYGDAPAPFPTLMSSNGASHTVVPGFSLGSRIDGELEGLPNSNATGDDIDNIDDEDGVEFISDLLPGADSVVSVTISNGSNDPGLLQGWIDFDGDGAWTTAGEQIFVNQAVSEGANSLSFSVPAWAELGDTFARFRYGYERGISFTGEAVAGEVEDYQVEIVRGGPVANDNSYNVRRNSEDVELNVTSNDSFRPGFDTQIVSVSSPSRGGEVEIATDGLSLLYSPSFDFVGSESFQYTLEDNNGLKDSATVTVFVQPDLAQIRLGFADINDGSPITQVSVGEQFLVQGFVKDLREFGTGVFAAYTDVEYPSSAATVEGVIFYGADYPNGRSGDTSTPGLVDEVGAFDGIDRLGPDEKLLFAVPMRAREAGIFEFEPNQADILPQNSVLLFDSSDPVAPEQIEFRSAELTITSQVTNVQLNPNNAMDVNDDTSVSPIDALLVINELNSGATPAARAADDKGDLFLDVSGDGVLSPLDALLIINELNNNSQRNGVNAIAAAIHNSPNTSEVERVTHNAEVSPQTTTRVSTETILGDRDELFGSLDEGQLWNDDGELETVLDLLGDDLDRNRL